MDIITEAGMATHAGDIVCEIIPEKLSPNILQDINRIK